jgi:zinc protease
MTSANSQQNKKFLRQFMLIGCALIFLNHTAQALSIENWQTEKGSRVYFVQTNELPITDIQVVFDAGSARDEQQFGLAALTANVLDTGTKTWNAEDIAQRFESVGANFNVHTTTDTTTASLRTLSDKPLFDKALETMRIILSNPRFAKTDFQREKKRTLAALKQREESPSELASMMLYKAIYQEHPYGHPSIGLLNTVEKITENDCRHFYEKYYTASNAIVVIIGNLTKKQAEETATLLTNDLIKGEKAKPLPNAPTLIQSDDIHLEFPSSQTHVLMGYTGINRKDPDYFPLYVGNQILGGGSLVSKLFEEIREKRGLAYSASSAFMPMLIQGIFVASLQTRNDQTKQAIDIMRNTISEFIENGVSDSELNTVKNNIIGSFPMRFDTNKELANYVTMIGFYEMPLDYLDTFQQKIQNVSTTDIKDAFKRHLAIDKFQTITVGKTQ